MTIRLASVDDLSNIMAIEQTAHVSPWSESVMHRYLNKKCVWVMEVDSKIIGHAALQTVAGEAELLTIAIDPTAQGHGYGRCLLQHIVEQAQHQQADQLFLEVRDSNQAAIALYESEGFCELGRRTNYYPTIGADGREDARIYGLPIIAQSFESSP